MRFFIAIEFDEGMLSALSSLQDDMRALGVKGNYTKLDNLHLTLAFIGDYGNPDDVLDAMEDAEFTEFSLALQGVGSYGELFWAGVKDNDELKTYVKRLRKALSDNGIPFDRKKFSPHITLIRRAVYRNGKVIPVEKVPKAEMRVRRISLMKSERGKNGMIYTEVGSVEI